MTILSVNNFLFYAYNEYMMDLESVKSVHNSAIKQNMSFDFSF